MQTGVKPVKTRYPMLLTACFNPSVVVEPRDEHLSAELGVLAMRELDERLRLTRTLARNLRDPRTQHLITHPMIELMRTRLYAIIQGWGDQDNLDRLRHDFSFRIGVSSETGNLPVSSPEGGDRPAGLSSQPTQSRLIATLSQAGNREALKAALLDWSLQSLALIKEAKLRELTADIDSSMWEVFGQPAGTDYNGHYGCSGYKVHLIYLHEARAWVAAELGIGSEYSSHGAPELMLPVISQLERKTGCRIRVRGDAAYADEKFMRPLEEHQDASGVHAPVRYCFRLKTNAVLNAMVAPYLKVPPGPRPQEPRSWVYELSYRAAEWRHGRRVILVVKEEPNKLFPEYFLLVTNYEKCEMSGQEVWDYYRQRGTMEADIAQLKTTLRPSLASSDRSPKEEQESRDEEARFSAAQKEAFSNEATLLVFLLAYNMMALGARLMTRVCPVADQAQSGHARGPRCQRATDKVAGWGWSLQRFREQVLKCAGRLLTGGKQLRVIVSAGASELWIRFWQAIATVQPYPQ